MAKLNKVVENNEIEAVQAETATVAKYEGARPSLNQLAIVLGIPAVRLQSAQVAYKPVEGQPYNAKAINWDAVDGFVERRLDKTDYATVAEVMEAAVAVDYTPKKGFGRSGSEGSVWGKVLFGTTPVRKGALKVGDKIYAKKTSEAFDVLYVDPTIVVYAPEHEEGTAVVSNSIGNRMFNMNFSSEPIVLASAATETAAE